ARARARQGALRGRLRVAQPPRLGAHPPRGGRPAPRALLTRGTPHGPDPRRPRPAVPVRADVVHGRVDGMTLPPNPPSSPAPPPEPRHVAVEELEAVVSG